MGLGPSSLMRWGLFFLFAVVFLIVIGPLLTGYNEAEMHLTHKNEPPSFQFWFGTDDLGRDIFTRVCYGAQISLLIGLLAAAVDLVIGLFWGGVAGLFGDLVDDVLMRTADILYALPYLLVVILIAVALDGGLLSLVVALTAIGWITMARIVRGQVMLLNKMDYVAAAKAIGAGPWRLLRVHLLPNAIQPILVTLTLTVPSAMFTEAFLSFLGLGIQAPQASLGTMVSEGISALQYYPWRLIFPATLLSVALFAFHLIGEGLKEASLRQETR